MLDIIGTLSPTEQLVDPHLGYPPAYAKLCSHSRALFADSPTACHLPYSLPSEEEAKLNELEGLFPQSPPEDADPSLARIHADFLWTQLDHLGNAGFDPSKFRVDPYGNVLHWGADPSSPLGWEVDHWFPRSRGGRTAVANLRLVQWQVAQAKCDRLEFSVRWWDLQLGISVNQFLFIMTSPNSEFRQRAFSFLFLPSEHSNNLISELESHFWPEHFQERAKQVGCAAAAIVRVKKDAHIEHMTEDTSEDKTATPGRRRSVAEEEKALLMALQKYRPMECSAEEEILARHSSIAAAMRREEDLCKKLVMEKHRTEEKLARMERELRIMRQQNEREKAALEELEGTMAKQKKRVEKQRQWSETQSHYRQCLERILRDTMHQSFVFKEQAKLNQAACTALLARLRSHKVNCERAELDLVQRSKAREALEILAQSNLVDFVCKHLIVEESCLDIKDPVGVDQNIPDNVLDDSTVSTPQDGCISEFVDEKRVLEDDAHKQLRSNAGISGNQLKQPSKGIRGMDTILEEEDLEEPPGHPHKSPSKRKVISGELDASDCQGQIDRDDCSQPTMQQLDCTAKDDRYVKEQEEEHLDKLLQELLMVQSETSDGTTDVHDEENEEQRVRRVGKSNVDKWLQKLLLSNTAGACVMAEKDVEVEGTRERICLGGSITKPDQTVSAAGNGEKSKRGLDGIFRRMSFRQDVKKLKVLREGLAVAHDEARSWELLDGQSLKHHEQMGGLRVDDSGQVDSLATKTTGQELIQGKVEDIAKVNYEEFMEACRKLNELSAKEAECEKAYDELIVSEAEFAKRMRQVREEDERKESGRMSVEKGGDVAPASVGLANEQEQQLNSKQHSREHQMQSGKMRKKVQAKSTENPSHTLLPSAAITGAHQVRRSCSMRAPSTGGWVLHTRKASSDQAFSEAAAEGEEVDIVLQPSSSLRRTNVHHHSSNAASNLQAGRKSSSSSASTAGLTAMGLKASLKTCSKAWRRAVSRKQ